MAKLPNDSFILQQKNDDHFSRKEMITRIQDLESEILDLKTQKLRQHEFSMIDYSINQSLHKEEKASLADFQMQI